MKKAVIYLITMLILCGCKANRTVSENNKNITFINEVKEADVWILPETEKNLKTTVWGTATILGIKTDESRKAPLSDAGDTGLYIIRMIDTDNIFYSADGIRLESGWTVRVTGEDLQSVKVEVIGENGVLKNTYEVFAASL